MTITASDAPAAVVPGASEAVPLPAPPVAPLTTAELSGWVSALASLTEATDDAECIDQIRLLEEVKNACAAAQAVVTVAFEASQLAAQDAAGAVRSDLGKGIGHQVALARRESPHRGNELMGLAKALVHEMPETLSQLASGTVSEYRARLVVKQTACLSREDRMQVDRELAGRLEVMGNRQVEDEAKKIAYRLDPYAFTERARRAAADRRVTLRPAPDTMSNLTGLLPAAQGVAAHAALRAQADALRAAGDPRSIGQLMADLFVEALTGRKPDEKAPTWADRINAITWDGCQSEPVAASDQRSRGTDAATAQRETGSRGAQEGVSVELQLMMSDQALFGYGPRAEEPGWLADYGPIPAPLARLIATGSLSPGGADPKPDESRGVQDPGVAAWVRRLYSRPDDGRLVAMESGRRAFTGLLRKFVAARDLRCRTPWCDAPIRHIDHVVPVESGGSTAENNGQGLCEACNYAKEAPGWRATTAQGDAPDDTGGAGESVTTTTPTGHCYVSRPPRPPDEHNPRSATRMRDPVRAA